MERPTGLKLKHYELPRNEQTGLIIIIILFHLVGLAGFAITTICPTFLPLVPWFLLLMLAVLIISHRPINANLVLYILVIFIAGFLVEWIGVNKHWLFGDYTYGSTLGVKLGGIPLTIGINWFLLVYATGVLMQRSRVRNILTRVFIGALILVLLDVLIEPVAVKYDYWHWAGGIVPLKNYACWFLISAAMLFGFEKFNFKKQSIVAPVFLAAQFVFFGVLALI